MKTDDVLTTEEKVIVTDQELVFETEGTIEEAVSPQIIQIETYSTIKETTEEVDQLNQGNESELMLERVKSTSG